MNVSEQIILLMNYLMEWERNREMYNEYLKQSCILHWRDKFNSFRAMLSKYVTLEALLHREYEMVLWTRENKYKEYLQWCDKSNYTPFAEPSFTDTTYMRIHHPVSSQEFTWGDKHYITNLWVYECKKRPVINQNMCLFYKFYFKRYAHRKNNENISWARN